MTPSKTVWTPYGPIKDIQTATCPTTGKPFVRPVAQHTGVWACYICKRDLHREHRTVGLSTAQVWKRFVVCPDNDACVAIARVLIVLEEGE